MKPRLLSATLYALLVLVCGCQSTPESPAVEANTEQTRGRVVAPAVAPEASSDAHAHVEAAPTPKPKPSGPPPFPSFDGEVPYAITALETEHTKDIQGAGPLFAELQTSRGTIRCRLYEDQVPSLVDNFVGLARGLKRWRDPHTGATTQRPLYDGLLIHRVEPGFIIQGGDPSGSGMGGPGYTLPGAFTPLLRFNQPGVLAMAQREPNKVGSQFFITLSAAPQLNDRYPIIGLCGDLDVIKTIADAPTLPTSHRPQDPVVINKIRFMRSELGDLR